jgi:CHAT domain-containing protein
MARLPELRAWRNWARPGCGLALLVACIFAAGRLAAQDSTATLEQARAIVGAVESQGFAAPPGTIADITAILDQQKPDAAAMAAARAKADSPAPADLKNVPLGRFYIERGTAAGDIGRDAQRLADYRQAYDLILPHRDKAVGDYATASNLLAGAEARAGMRKQALALREEKIAFLESAAEGGMEAKKKNAHQGALFGEYSSLVGLYVGFGQIGDAQQTLDKADALLVRSQGWKNVGGYASIFQSRTDWAHAIFLDGTGRPAAAEPYYRKALTENLAGIEALQAAANAEQNLSLDAIVNSQNSILQALAHNLALQGRLYEAESAERLALLDILKRHGRYAVETAQNLQGLGGILLEEGRPTDTEKLARAAIDIYQRLGHGPDSIALNSAHLDLAQALVVEKRYAAGAAEFDLIRRNLAGDPQAVVNLTGNTPAYTVALLRTGQAAAALADAKAMYERRKRALGGKHYDTAEAEGFYAAALAATGEKADADRAFREAVPLLLDASRVSSDSQGSTQGRQRRLHFILENYLGLLWTERAAIGPDAAAGEAFRIADAARGQAVQHALVAAAARAAVHDPGLSDLVRRSQDAEHQISALNATLAQALSVADDQQDAASIHALRVQIDQLRGARATLREEIEKRFPDYVNLIDPRPIVPAEAQAVLKPGQALIATYVAEDRTYVWAMRHDGRVAFTAADLGTAAVNADVAALRRALDPDAESLAQIPAFDVVAASKLYEALLKPVEAGWKGASDLLIVPHGALAELPFSLLVTQPAEPVSDPAGGPLFSGYKTVPWLIRQASVTQLPSVSSLRALAALASAAPAPRPFIGFGDAWFNSKEAQEGAAALQLASASGGASVTMRGAKVKFRSVPQEGVAAPDLSVLPRLPETVDELRAAAKALGADPAHDVYLGKQASEHQVRSLKLDDRRVVMFATHGLVPGDIAGLSEPALALTPASISGAPGSGLLTTTKILGLRLNAQWVVLSACNTAAGNGAGAEAVTGLGLAFIYAGTRAVLVSNWPVETTSARLLTTGIFAELARHPGTSRAAALEAAMLALIDAPGYLDPSGKPIFSYAHPIFWAPFTLVGDGGT